MRAMTRPLGLIGWDGRRHDKTRLLMQAIKRPTDLPSESKHVLCGSAAKTPANQAKKSPALQGFVGRDVEPVAVVLARSGVWVRVP